MTPPLSQDIGIMDTTPYVSTGIEEITDGSINANESLDLASVPGAKQTRKRKRSYLVDSDQDDFVPVKVVSKTKKSKKRSRQRTYEDSMETDEINAKESMGLASLPKLNRKSTRSPLDDENDGSFLQKKAKHKKSKKRSKRSPDSDSSDHTKIKKHKTKKHKLLVEDSVNGAAKSDKDVKQKMEPKKKNKKSKSSKSPKFQIVAALHHVSISLIMSFVYLVVICFCRLNICKRFY
jgi:hypothetical protein